jgi:hypothetical protein
MEQSLFKSNHSLVRQEIPWILWMSNIHYQIHKSPPLVPTQSHNNQVRIPPSDIVDPFSYYTPTHV